MKCKNCGANLPKGASICINCGAVQKTQEDYIKFSDIPSEDYENEKKHNNSVKKFVIISTIIILLVGVVAYFVFYEINVKKPQPELSFTSGQGVINGDEEVVYVAFEDSSKVQYIQGVKIYDGEVNSNSINIGNALSSDYEYTKNIDGSFRAIYFDAEDLNLSSNTNYTFTFQITVSFYSDENQYTYYESMNMSTDNTADISDEVFDHSQTVKETTTTETTTTENSNAETTTAKSLSTDSDYIVDGYWYTTPVKNGDSYSISAINFKDDGTYTTTNYTKTGTDDWTVSTSNGTYSVSDDTLTVNNGNSSESSNYKLDDDKNTITSSENSSVSLSSRKYNSVENAEDFFGL